MLKVVGKYFFLQFIMFYTQYESFIHNLRTEQLNSGTKNRSCEEEAIPPFLINRTALLDELALINSHVHKLIDFLNDTRNNEDSQSMKIAHVHGEMMSLYDSLADLPVDENYMKNNLSMTYSEIEKANHLYYNSIGYIYSFNKLLGT